MVLSNGNMAWVMRSYSVRGGDPRSVEGGAVEEGQKREHPRCATERGTSEVDDQQKRGRERGKGDWTTTTIEPGLIRTQY